MCHVFVNLPLGHHDIYHIFFQFQKKKKKTFLMENFRLKRMLLSPIIVLLCSVVSDKPNKITFNLIQNGN